tara:strand:+ start:308 stop:2299 length:1992 start_codon:yes stop_codon:yes gene_type:complete
MANFKKTMMAAAGAGGGGGDVDDVFSTYLYEGNGSTQTITNGIDLAGEGGMAWFKSRSNSSYPSMFDTERGAFKFLYVSQPWAETNGNAATYPPTGSLRQFNSNGFEVGSYDDINKSGQNYASWTFRKAPKFFDMVTYTGNGANDARTISHNLGSTPGMVIVKRVNGGGDWYVYHRGLNISGAAPQDQFLTLDSAYGSGNSPWAWNDTAPTDTAFTVKTAISNVSGANYIAYLFAHNDGDGEFGPDSDQDIIKCGNYTGTGTIGSPAIDLGFEPQWVLTKRTDTNGNWIIQDNKRSLSTTYTDMLFPNLNNAATTGAYPSVVPTATGFYIGDAGTNYNSSGGKYIYMAIRRGSLFPPESGTEAFAIDTGTGASGHPKYISNFPVDMSIITSMTGSEDNYTVSRLAQRKYLVTNDPDTESGDNANFSMDFNEGFFEAGGGNRVAWMWKRAPSFFDVVSWKVDGTGNQTLNHSLGVIPEMIISKNRNMPNFTWGQWVVGHKDLQGWDGTNENARHTLKLHDTSASGQQGYHRDFTDTSFRMTSIAAGGYNTSHSVTAYLFATLDGVSKVGSYTGNGSNQTINCGFSSGARFIMVKRADSTGAWYVWDTERGISTGNDSSIKLDDPAAQYDYYDDVDPHSSGFIINQVAGTNLNVTNGTYIFYAIA